jgi:hypothetical protein
MIGRIFILPLLGLQEILNFKTFSSNFIGAFPKQMQQTLFSFCTEGA